MKRTQQGFSLVELVISMSIVGILVAAGVPSYKYFTTNNRISGEINALLGDYQFARAEAVREGSTVTVCASTDGATCSGTATWSTGWLVFSDTGTIGAVDGTDQILRVAPAVKGGDTFVADTANWNAITFNREGFAQNMPGPVWLRLKNSTAINQYERCLSITVVGAFTTTKYDGTNCK
jgi:type IV fimbrial biogenesis protein FimT